MRLTNGEQDLFIGTRNGMAIRFRETDVRAAGRFTQGVAGINLEQDDYVVGAEVIRPGGTILTTCERGFGKRSDVEEYRLIKRGGKGVINVRITEKNGPVVGVNEVTDQDELIVITEKGQTIRCRVSDFRVIGRATQGVRLFNIPEDDRITAVSRVEPEEEDGEVEEGGDDLLAGGEEQAPEGDNEAPQAEE